LCYRKTTGALHKFWEDHFHDLELNDFGFAVSFNALIFVANDGRNIYNGVYTK
jgi:hypothetical protein